jgi:hypothetical protein
MKMVFGNLLNGGPSHNGPLVGLSESTRGGTLGTNTRHEPLHVLTVHGKVLRFTFFNKSRPVLF